MAVMLSPVISKQIPGPALSWTLSSEESLKTGGMYAWYVQAVDASGNALGPWSNGKVFRVEVEQEVRFAGIEEMLAGKLREYGVNEETITNILSDMKSGVKEVVVRGAGRAGSKNTPDLRGVQGVESSTRTLYGLEAGASITSGTGNTFIGYRAGRFNTTGDFNTFLGHHAGYFNTTGLGNVFLGYNAGYNETGSNKLYISNSAASSPLIYGEFNNNIVTVNGQLGIGVNPSYPLHMSSGAYCSTGGTWTNASSRALKENIESLSAAEAMDALTKLNPVKYNYKVDKVDKHVGFIAEDVPDLVAAADRKGLSPMDITAVLTKVVQELRKENQEYKKIISDLRERMAKLEKK